MKMPTRILLLAAAASLLVACAHVPAPPFPEAPAPVTLSFELPSPLEPEEPYVQGLYLAPAKDGRPPEIHVGRFRWINFDQFGELRFDVQGLTKLQSALEGSSAIRDYVMRISNSKMGLAPDINLIGIYRFEGDVATLDYDDVRETSFACPFESKLRSTVSDYDWDYDRRHLKYPSEEVANGERGEVFRVPDVIEKASHSVASCTVIRPLDAKSAQSAPGVASVPFHVVCSPKGWQELAASYQDGKRRWDSEEKSYQYEHAQTDAATARKLADDFKARVAREIPEAIQTFLKEQKRAYALCDPTGRMLAAWDGRSFWHTGRIEMMVFSPSTNPLYPAPKYYAHWSTKSAESLKNALQILYLVSQEKSRAARH
jgi:hypothetical protein